MTETVLFFLHHGLTLLMGVMLSAAFAGVRFTKKNTLIVSGIFLVLGVAQILALAVFGEASVWKLYPVIAHLPLGIALCLIFRKRVLTVFSSVSLSYLCCQPSSWFGTLAQTLGQEPTAVLGVRICATVIVFVLVFFYFSDFVAQITGKDTRNVVIFRCVPFVYYLLDYAVGIYTDIWQRHMDLVSEFLSFFLCAVFMAFCVVYYREYERSLQIQQKNQIIELTVQQQAKEIEAIRKSNLETVLLRHDMRHLLSSIALCIEQDDKETARNLIAGYVSEIDSAAVRRYCENDTLNYILSNYREKCEKAGISFRVDISLKDLPVDELLFASILSNALDNAVNAQAELPEEERIIKLLLKESGGKLLLSVKNPFREAPDFSNDTIPVPIVRKDGHGYGTQSILYLTEKLGGNCQFSVQNNMFVLRVVL